MANTAEQTRAAIKQLQDQLDRTSDPAERQRIQDDLNDLAGPFGDGDGLDD